MSQTLPNKKLLMCSGKKNDCKTLKQFLFNKNDKHEKNYYQEDEKFKKHEE
jgi:hypothetical protein